MAYGLSSIKMEDSIPIMKWRNEQIGPCGRTNLYKEDQLQILRRNRPAQFSGKTRSSSPQIHS